MLGKLFKYEMKAMARLLLPIFLILAVLTVVDRIVIYLDIFKGVLSVIPGMITFAYVLSIIAIVVASSLLVIYRFYKNLMTDEGYLMFTLPVKPHELILSKLMSSFLWMIASLVVFALSILFVASGSFSFNEFIDGLKQLMTLIKKEFDSQTVLFLIQLAVLFILGVINNILIVYASIAIGQLFHSHKIIGSIGAYIGINTVLQIITSVGTASIAITTKSIDDIASIPQIILPVTIILLLILNTIYYYVTTLLLTRKLNLE